MIGTAILTLALVLSVLILYPIFFSRSLVKPLHSLLDGVGQVEEGDFEVKIPVMVEDEIPPKDSKTILQEWAQGKGLPLPKYREMSKHGPDHDPEFVFEVKVEGYEPTIGNGLSKRAAQQVAAFLALKQLGLEK